MTDLFDFVRGPGGCLEITRGLGAFGGVAYVITSTAIAFLTEASLTEYCLQMPLGLAAVIGSAATGARWKDKGVANAKVIEKGAQP